VHGDLPQLDRALHGGAMAFPGLHGLQQDGRLHGGAQGQGTMGVAPMPASWESSGGGSGGKTELMVLRRWSLAIGSTYVAQS